MFVINTPIIFRSSKANEVRSSSKRLSDTERGNIKAKTDAIIKKYKIKTKKTEL